MHGFSERLRKMMDERRLSQQQLAGIARVSRPAIGKWLSGKVTPQRATLTRLAFALGTSEDWLLRGVAAGGRVEIQGTKVDFNEFDARMSGFAEPIAVMQSEYDQIIVDAQERIASAEEKKRTTIPRLWHHVARELVRLLSEVKKHSLQKSVIDVDQQNIMPSSVKDLLGIVRRLTREPGSKVAFAKSIGVRPQHLSAWLAGEFQPGGDATLKMLERVRELEAQQKQSVEGVQTPPTRQTRFRSSTSSHEKPKSDPKKRSDRRSKNTKQKSR